MAGARYHFGPFVLDSEHRTLHQIGHEAGHGDVHPVPLNSRYFDALVMLVENAGELISKDRFNEEVWRSVPVTDEALTQCIRSLRSALGDKARTPRFIETVPKHGYRFVAEVSQAPGADSAPGTSSTGPTPSPSPAGTPREAAGRMLAHAVAGFTDAELSVEVRENALIVAAKKADEATDRTYLHRGIATRAFERKFQLADHIRVNGAVHENGMLHIDLVREVPEALKPRRIAIASSAAVDGKAVETEEVSVN